MAGKHLNGLHHRNGLRAFTLIELLSVVAVLSLAAAILFPALAKVRVQAARIACQSNLRQIASAWHVYLSDSGDRFLQAPNAHLLYGGWEGTSWSSVPAARLRPLNPFAGLPRAATEREATLFRCPADRGGSPNPLPSAYQYFGTSYQTNRLLIGNVHMGLPDDAHQPLVDRINARLPGLRSSHVDQPSRVVLVGDYGWVNHWLPRSTRRHDWHGRSCHANLAFMDGHVDFTRIRKGLYLSEAYRILPFANLDDLAISVQTEIPCGEDP